MTRYLEFGDYCEIAGEILGLTPEQIADLPNAHLADSAMAAPRAGFGGQDAYPSLLEKASVLVEHLARNHPLPDGNKRAAFLSLWLFMEVNDTPFTATDPDTDVPMMERIAAGDATHDQIIAWLRTRTVVSQ